MLGLELPFLWLAVQRKVSTVVEILSKMKITVNGLVVAALILIAAFTSWRLVAYGKKIEREREAKARAAATISLNKQLKIILQAGTASAEELDTDVSLVSKEVADTLNEMFAANRAARAELLRQAQARQAAQATSGQPTQCPDSGTPIVGIPSLPGVPLRVLDAIDRINVKKGGR